MYNIVQVYIIVHCTGVVAVGLFSAVFNVPRWMESTLVREPINNGTIIINKLLRTELGNSFTYQHSYTSRTRDNSFTYQLIYFDTLYYIFMFVLPLLLLTVFNTRLIIVYQRFRRKRVALHGFGGSTSE